jgi:CPA2 family monovalent cation:H+ antiporter-2
MIETARTLNPHIQTVVRTHSDSDAELLRSERAGEIFMGEQELAKGMSAHVLAQFAQKQQRPH